MKTYEPVSRDKGEVQIEGSFGTGAVVSGQGEPATILVNKVTGTVTVVNNLSQAGTKKVYRDGRVVVVDVTGEETTEEVIPEDVVTRLAEIGKSIERMFFGWTQDIEWVLAPDGQIFIVQARPIPEALLDLEIGGAYISTYDELLPEITDAELMALEGMRKDGDIDGLVNALIPHETKEISLSKKDRAKRAIAAAYLEMLLSEKENRQRLTEENVKGIMDFAKRSILSGWKIVPVIGYLGDTPYADVARETLAELNDSPFMFHLGRFACAGADFKLGEYKTGVDSLKKINFANDNVRSISALMLRIIDDNIASRDDVPVAVKEELVRPLLVDMRDRFAGEWVSEQAQILINKLTPGWEEVIAAAPEAKKPAEEAPFPLPEAIEPEVPVSAVERGEALKRVLDVEVLTDEGVHMRPSAMVFQAAQKNEVKITITSGGSVVEVNNAMAMVMLELLKGASFTMTVEGQSDKVKGFMTAIADISEEISNAKGEKEKKRVFGFDEEISAPAPVVTAEPVEAAKRVLDAEVLTVEGVHMRPSVMVFQAAKNNEVKVTVTSGDMTVEVNNPMAMVMLTLMKGASFTMTVEGQSDKVKSFMTALADISEEIKNDKGEIERTPVFGLKEKAAAEVEAAAVAEERPIDRIMEEFPAVIGLPMGVYEKIGEEGIARIAEETGASIVAVPGADTQEMMEALDLKISGTRSIAALLDISSEDVLSGDSDGKVAEIAGDFAQRARRDILELMNPEISGLTPENVKKIQNVGELAGIAGILARVIPSISSIRLTEKSIYDLRINSLYNTHRVDYTPEAMKFMESLKTQDVRENERHFMVTAVDKAMDLRLLAESIKARREAMEITDAEMDPVRDIVVVKNREIAANLEEALEVTGLAEFITVGNVIVLEEGETLLPSEITARIEKLTGETPNMRQVAVAAKTGVIDVDRTSPDEVLNSSRKDSLLLVQLEDGLVSQLYRMTLEIMANGDNAPAVIDGELTRVNGYNYFIYLPRITKVDLDTEMRNYERYIQEVLTKA
ncbi:MAG: HPr family phosphocarrier protein, partial [Candidatus Omnitrophica bacterium]|nr:HPr family phosphocarrier protein [Candidatus Omnitrophota bacterium]